MEKAFSEEWDSVSALNTYKFVEYGLQTAMLSLAT